MRKMISGCQSHQILRSGSIAWFVAIAGLAASTTSGAVIIWDGSVGDWDDDARWGGTEPTSIDDVFISAGIVSVTSAGETASTVNMTDSTLNIDGGNLSADFLSLFNSQLSITNSGFLSLGPSAAISLDSGSLLVSGAGSQLNGAPATPLQTGSSGAVDIDVNAGGIVDLDSSTFLAINPGGNTTLDIDGVGSEYRTLDLIMAESADSIATVSNGGFLDIGNNLDMLSSMGVTTSLTVTGAGSMVDVGGTLTVGNGGDAHLSVLDGAVVDVTGGFRLAESNASGSAVIVDGVGSQISTTNDVISLIGGGDSTMTISNGGVVTTPSRIIIGDNAGPAGATNSTITATGAGSTLSAGTRLDVGDQNVGHLEVLNGASATAATLTVAFNPLLFAGTSTLDIDGSNSQIQATDSFTVGRGDIGVMTVSNGGTAISDGGSVIGELTGSDGSSVTITGAGSRWDNNSFLTVGVEGTSSLNVLDGGRVDVDGNLILGRFPGADGSTILVDGPGSVLAVDGSFLLSQSTISTDLTVSNGGRLENPGGLAVGSGVSSTGTNLTVTGTDSIFEAIGTGAEVLTVGGNGPGTLNFEDGGRLFMRNQAEFRVGDSVNSSGQVIATGVGSIFDATGVDFTIGRSSLGSVSILDGALGGMGNAVVGTLSGSTNSSLNVQGAGSALATDDLTIGLGSSANLTVTNGGALNASSIDAGVTTASQGSTITVGGTDSILTVNNMRLGADSVAGSNANVSINSGGVLVANNTLRLENNSSITMSERTSRLSVDFTSMDSGAAFNWIGGALEVDRNFSLDDSTSNFINNGSGQGQLPMDAFLRLDDSPTTGRDMIVNGTITIAEKSLQITGGSLTAEQIDVASDAPNGIDFNSGSITITDGDIVIGENGAFRSSSLDLRDGKELNVSGSVYVDSFASLQVRDDPLDAGELVLLNGATLERDVGFTLPSTVNASINASNGSRINVENGDMVIGRTDSNSGVYINGRVEVGTHMLTLRDANSAIFDSGARVTFGELSTEGFVVADNGITLDFGANFEGHGVIDTPDSILTPLINNGSITGETLSRPITLEGYIKGAGTFDNVFFNGTFSPGLSPTISIVGNSGLGETARLLMELGGTTPGSEHDQMLLTGELALGGALDVVLINGYEPAEGDSFVLFDLASAGGTLSGSFDDINLPRLPGPLRFIWSDASTLAVVPGPGTAAVLAGGALLGLRRRRS